MSLGRRLLAIAVLVLFGIGMAFGVVEAGVRMLHLVPSRFWEPDAVLGSKLVPGRSGWWTQEEREFVVAVRINADGRRDLDHPRDKAPGTYRILLLGDSFVEAMQVPIEETFARQLEKLSQADGRPIEVVSMGVSGYGTASQYLYYRDLGRTFRPDLVLLSFYPGNDVRNNSPTLEPTLRPSYDAAGNIERVAAGKTGGDGGGRGWLGQSAAYTYARKLLLTRQPALAARLADWGLLSRAALRPLPMVAGVPVDYWIYAETAPPDWDEAWTHTERLLGALRDAVTADGARFAVMVVSAREQIYPDDWRTVLATYPDMQRVAWDVNGPERRTLDWCQRNGVVCVSMSQAFLAERDRQPRLHFQYDGHWTAAGHALAARTMETFLRSGALRPVQYAEGQ